MTRHMQSRDDSRGKNSIYFEDADRNCIASEIARVGAKSVLEFGPGDSTQAILDCGVEKVVTCEDIDKWLNVARDRFDKEPRVRVLRFFDEMPVRVEELPDDETFDIAFVDAPKGFNPVRKVHEGIADCSRLNTLLYALGRCPVVLLHDATRPLERASLGRVWATGQVDIEFLPTRIGMARITKRHVENEDRPDPPGVAKPRKSAAWTKPKRRGKPVDGRSDRSHDCKPKDKKHRRLVNG